MTDEIDFRAPIKRYYSQFKFAVAVGVRKATKKDARPAMDLHEFLEIYRPDPPEWSPDVA